MTMRRWRYLIGQLFWQGKKAVVALHSGRKVRANTWLGTTLHVSPCLGMQTQSTGLFGPKAQIKKAHIMSSIKH